MGRSSFQESVRAYGVLILYLVAVKVVIVAVGPTAVGFRSPSQAAVFSWPAIAVFLVIGAAAVWAIDRVGLPGVWPAAIPLRDRLAVPLGLGLGLGGLAVLVDLLTGWAAASAAQMGIPSIHLPFPGSVIIYPGAAIIVNVIYYLVPIAALFGIAVLLLPTARWHGVAFWTIGALSASIEPVTQAAGNGVAGSLLWVFVAQDYAFNLAQVWIFRRAGFGASVVLRAGMYLVWHVLYGVMQ